LCQSSAEQMSVSARGDNWLGGGGCRSVRAAQVAAAAGELTRKDYARRCKNAVAGSGKRSLSERARSRRIIGLVWTGLDAERGTVVVFVETTQKSDTKRIDKCRVQKGKACHEKVSLVRRATATGIKTLLSTTYHQGPTGMARLGRGRAWRQPTRRADQATQAR
jgi:hypothetical protein